MVKNSKILLLLDNCTAHPAADILEKDNVRVVFLPPNCTSLIQPMDQGVLNSLKCLYKAAFIRECLEFCNLGNGIQDFQKQFTIKNALWSIANSWNAVKKDTLVNAWHNIWPATIFLDGEENNEFHAFRVSQEKEIAQELLEYAKNVQSEEIDEKSIQDSLIADKDAPTVGKLTDGEIVSGVFKIKDAESSSDETDAEEEEKPGSISIDRCLELTKELIRGMEQKSFFNEHDIMSVYKIQQTLLLEKPKHLKQKKISEMFATFSKK